MATELRIRTIEQKIIPILSSRTRSDPKYDLFVKKLLEELNIRKVDPITCHLQRDVPGLSVIATEFETPVFYFSPSIRSFDALRLLYHEIGHVFWEKRLAKQDRWRLLTLMFPLHHDWPRLSQSLGPTNKITSKDIQNTPALMYVHMRQREIAADTFASLVGGHIYAPELAMLLSLRLGNVNITDPRYPEPAGRIWFSRLAADLVTPLNATKDPLYAAVDAVHAIRTKSATNELRNDEASAQKLCDEYRRILIKREVPLAPPFAPLPPRSAVPPTVRGTSIREALAVATRYQCSVRWPIYRSWEQAMFNSIGLGSNGLLRRWL